MQTLAERRQKFQREENGRRAEMMHIKETAHHNVLKPLPLSDIFYDC